MVVRHTLTKAQVKRAMELGDFDTDVRGAGEIVIVLMTQDWCPQWKKMASWLYDWDIDLEIHLFELVYNKTDYFQEFRAFKETLWHNYEIPYLRYYHNGKWIDESNAVEGYRIKSIFDIN